MNSNETHEKPTMIEKVKSTIQLLWSGRIWSFDLGILVLRLNCSLMLIHGWQKWQDFSNDSKDWPDPFHVGSTFSYSLTVFAELFCTIFIVLGLFTRIALLPLIICMLVIVWSIHSGEPLGEREHGLLYLMCYISLWFTGSGKFSIDHLMKKNKPNS